MKHNRAFGLLCAVGFAAACSHESPVRAQTAPLNTPTITDAPPVPYVPSGAKGQVGADVPAFWVRPGYRVTLAAADFGESRFMVFDDKGTLYVSQPGPGRIVALKKDGDRFVKLGDFITGKRSVHGLDFADGWVWFTTTGAIYKARDTNGDGKADDVQTVIPDGQLPTGGGHWWRSICVTDRYIFTSIGDPGNISDETGTEREKVWRFDKDGSGKHFWCGGLRNTEKLRIRPGTQELWGADHGSDWFGQPLGDRQGNQPITDWMPPCEFNHYVEGGFYGHPFIVGNRVPRVEFQKKDDIVKLAAATIPPAWSFGPHWAPNGWTFLNKTALGSDFAGDALIGLHGSWNSSVKQGYRVERVLFDKATGDPYGGQPMVICLSANGDVLGRPVDVVEAPDGAVYFSDDQNQCIYRLSKI